MGCCGGGIRSRQVTKQPTKQSAQKQSIKPQASQNKPMAIKVRQAVKPASIIRQYIHPQLKCSKCGYPTMTVNISGRERHQCTNANCRTIIQ